MYKPANVREFITPAVHKKAIEQTVNGRLVKSLEVVGTLRGKFRQKGCAEIGANGLTVINENTTFITWYNSNLEPSDVLEINGKNYEIKGNVENVEMRGRYAIINLERIYGGA